jgi:hypothetical protein
LLLYLLPIAAAAATYYYHLVLRHADLCEDLDWQHQQRLISRALGENNYYLNNKFI